MERIILLICMIVASSAHAEEPSPIGPKQAPFESIKALESSIVLDYQTDAQVSSGTQDAAKWKAFCAAFGKSLRSRKSQIGFAKEARCLELGQLPDGDKLEPQFQWRIQVFEKRHVFDLNLMFRQDKQWITVYSMNLLRSIDPLNLLKHGEVPLLLARLFIDRLPTGWVLRPADVKDEVMFIKRDDGVRLPETLYVYQLGFDPVAQTWNPQIYSVLRRQGEPRILKKKVLGEVYTWERRYIPLSRSESYWVQNTEGVGRLESELMRVLLEKNPLLKFLDAVEKMALDSLDSNYFGLRYGKSMQRNSKLLASLQELSLLMEMRSGALDGFRAYADYMPRTRVIDNGLHQDLFLQRFAVGWAFKGDLPWGMHALASEWNIQPKVGILDFDGNFEMAGKFKNSFLNLGLKHYLDVALELGIEKETDWFRYRLWTSGNTSALGKAQKAEGSVRSLRLGLDTYWELITFQARSHLDLMLYGHFERIDIEKNPDRIPVDAPAVSQLSLTLPIVGGGLTFEW